MAVYQQAKKASAGQAERLDWYCDFTWADPATGRKRRIRRPLKDEKQRPVKSRTAAEAAENRIRAQLAAGTYEAATPDSMPDSAPLTVSSFWDRYTSEHVARNKPSSRAAIETIYRVSLATTIAEVPLTEVGAEHYARIAASMRSEGRSPKTINNALSALRTALVMAHEWGLREAPPKVRWEKVPEAEIEFFGPDEIKKLVETQDPMVIVAAKSGLRLGELLALRWGDIDLGKAPKVTVSKSVWWAKGEAHEGSTKGTRIRVVPLPVSAAEALRAMKPSSVRSDQHVFATPEGKALTKGDTKWRLWRTCDAAGLPRCGWHKLRHSYVSALVAAAVPLPQVMALAGHARIEMTMRYTHVSPDHLRSAVSVLD